MNQIRALLVDGDSEAARDVERQLEELGCSVAAVVDDGVKALDILQRSGIEIVLIHANVSGSMDAFELAGRVRDEAGRPILLFADQWDVESARRAAECGACGLMAAPLRGDVLRAHIELAVRRHVADSELRARERRYRLLAEHSTDMISAHAADGRIIFASSGCADLFGYEPEQLLDSDIYEDIHPDDVDAVRRTHQAILQGEPSRVAYRVRAKQGHYVWVETTCRALHAPRTGEAIEMVAVTRDISERKQIERERERIQRLESVGTLAGGIAHDFNNLLTGILGNISLAQVFCQPDDEIGELLIEAENASLQAKALTQQLLIFAKGGDPVKKRMSLANLLIDSTQLALKTSSAQVEFDIAADLWPVEVDAGQFGQVIRNIVNNADQAMPDGGVLRVRARNCPPTDGAGTLLRGPLVKISLQDSGTGIPDDHLRRVFDPYFTTKQRGSGLGLAVAHSVVAAHGGYITVESRLGEGATFHIYLPAYVATQERPPVAPSTRPPGRRRLLVMDDEQLVRDVACRILRHLGYDCISTENGEEAVEAYREALEAGQPFDVVIMDLIVLGGMGGKEALARLLEIDPTVRALVSSGYSTDPVLTNYAAHGFLGVISKPYQIVDLQQAIDAAMS
jgi:two-component system, cell cycle sensor histidine kinase and response regulator CckA